MYMLQLERQGNVKQARAQISGTMLKRSSIIYSLPCDWILQRAYYPSNISHLMTGCKEIYFVFEDFNVS